MTEHNIPDHWDSADDLLDFAIEREQDAVDFYNDLASKADNDAMVSVFNEFATVETAHKLRLQKIKESGHLKSASGKIQNLKIGDYLVEAEPTPDMDYQQALIIAMKREQAAQQLYSDLAQTTDDAKMKQTMLALSEEEAKHKLYFETEYDEYVLKEN